MGAKAIAVLLIIAGFFALVVGIAFVSAFFLQWAWNGAVVVVFGAKAITWLQAFQLSIVASTLLKSTQSNTNKA